MKSITVKWWRKLMNNNTVVVILIVALIGIGIISYKEDQRCTKNPTPSCHYTLRDKAGPF